MYMDQKWRDRIVVNEKILVGKPVIKGTRIGVDVILGFLAQGWTEQQILENYPQLKREDIRAALEYSANIIKLESIYPL